MTKSCVVFDERLTGYDFGPSHPMAPVRIDLTMQLARAMGIVDLVDVVGAEPLTDRELARLHRPEYIERVAKLSEHPITADPMIGLGTEDNPVFAGMHHASALIAGASVEAARRVWSGERNRAANVAGGLHHAMPGQASGFCIYNDVALAIAWLLDHGAERVAYVDVDAHHGDGVQAMFYDDPRVLTVSIHESPQSLFPGTGNVTETGGPNAPGSAVNIPLPPGTSDAGWLRAFHAIVPHVLTEFSPQILVSQHGCDSHLEDPLTNLMLSVDGQRQSYLALRDLSEQLCDGLWVATGGGGYSVLNVVPRAWTHLLGIIAGAPVDPQLPLPADIYERIAELRGGPGPRRMTDGRSAEYTPWENGYDPSNWLDRSIHSARQAVFPQLGIDMAF